MPTELTVHAVHEGAMRITATARDHSVTMDYPAQPGSAGPTPLEMLLASLAACSGNTLAALMRRAEQPFAGLEVTARGLRRDEHPTGFSEIALEFVVHGAGVDPTAVERALAQAEATICPAWAMLKPATEITATFRVVPSGAS